MDSPLCNEGRCPQHDWICELPAGHDGEHGCSTDSDLRVQRYERERAIADRIAAHKALHETGFVTTPDED